LTVLSLLLLFTVSIVAQEQEEMTSDEWEAEMARLRSQKDALNQQITDLQNDISKLKDQLNGMKSFEDCQNELYALVGATKADVDNFRNAVNELNGKVGRKEGPKADRQKDLDALKSNKISALPEFYDKVHNQMQSAMDSWVEQPTEQQYTVVKGDCLWNIAKKKDFYGNGFAWPKIYKANRDKIKNPDLIYPKQVFTIPQLTDEEKAKYDKMRENYKPAPVQ
ncbi:MAG TPA: LysM peptidoglycan-binding domain-containing protein, partial [Ignavibacteriaceae bacterium]|nr:LysM peptidoglycan-binding domain-containing protein [Ignavibacteriaceae bacterium]